MTNLATVSAKADNLAFRMQDKYDKDGGPLNGAVALDGDSSYLDYTAGRAVVAGDDNGSLAYVNGADQQTYYAGRQINTVIPAGGVVINSTSPIVIVQVTVSANVRYRFKLMMHYTQDAAGNNSAVFGWDGTASTAWGMYETVFHVTGGGTGAAQWGYCGGSPGGLLTGPAIAQGATEMVRQEGWVKFSGGGTWSIRGQENGSGQQWTVSARSFLEVMPVADT